MKHTDVTYYYVLRDWASPMWSSNHHSNIDEVRYEFETCYLTSEYWRKRPQVIEKHTILRTGTTKIEVTEDIETLDAYEKAK